MTARRQLLRRLVDGLPRSAEFVLYPDHPLLFRGPDLLSVQGGKIVAYFLYSTRESYTAPTQRSRLLLSRLALPRDAAVVLAVENSAHVNKLNRGVPLHDLLWEIPTGSLYDVPAGHINLHFGAEVVNELRVFHHRRFAEAWQASIDADFRSNRPTTAVQTTTAQLRRRRREVKRSDSVDSTPTQGVTQATASNFSNPAMPYFGGSPENSPSPPSESDQRLHARMSNTSQRASRPRNAPVPDISRTLLRNSTAAVAEDYFIDRNGNEILEALEMLRHGVATLEQRIFTLAGTLSPRGFDVVKPVRAAAFAGIESRVEGLG